MIIICSTANKVNVHEDSRRIHVEKAPKHNHLSAVAFALDSTFNCNLNPAPENYGTALLVFHPDVIDQTAPQFFPELCLFSHQIFQLGDEVREYLLFLILSSSPWSL